MIWLSTESQTYFGKEFDLLVMGRLFSFPTADDGFCKDTSNTKLAGVKKNKNQTVIDRNLETEQLFKGP